MAFVKAMHCIKCKHEITRDEYHSCDNVCPHCGNVSNSSGFYPDVIESVVERAELDFTKPRHRSEPSPTIESVVITFVVGGMIYLTLWWMVLAMYSAK